MRTYLISHQIDFLIAFSPVKLLPGSCNNCIIARHETFQYTAPQCGKCHIICVHIAADDLMLLRKISFIL